MICRRCGAENRREATHCANCFAELEHNQAAAGAADGGSTSMSLDELIGSSVVVARRIVDLPPPPPASAASPSDPKAWKTASPDEFKLPVATPPTPYVSLPETEKLEPVGGLKPGFFNYRRSDTKLLVVTALATPRERIGAAIYDTVFVATVIGYAGVMVILGVVFANFSRLLVWHDITLTELANSWVRPCVVGFFFLFTALSFVYCFIATTLSGQTWGKQTRHIRVVQADGSTPSVVKALLRTLYGLPINLSFCVAVWFVRPEIALVSLIFLAGIPTAFLNPERQALHDRLAGTYVVSTKELTETIDF